MLQLLSFISWLLNLYIYILIASAVFSWLYAFNLINASNDFVRSIGQVLYQITEPVLRPVRSVLPNFGGIDLSPIVVIIGIFFIQTVILPNIANLVT